MTEILVLVDPVSCLLGGEDFIHKSSVLHVVIIIIISSYNKKLPELHRSTAEKLIFYTSIPKPCHEIDTTYCEPIHKFLYML